MGCGHFSTYIGELQRRGLIDVAGRDDVGITEAGFEAIGVDPPAEPQSRAELVAMWREHLPAAAVRILDALIEVYPDGMDREEVVERTGLTASGGTFGAAVGALRPYASSRVRSGSADAARTGGFRPHAREIPGVARAVGGMGGAS
jgi:hypothetical protein